MHFHIELKQELDFVDWYVLLNKLIFFLELRDITLIEFSKTELEEPSLSLEYLINQFKTEKHKAFEGFINFSIEFKGSESDRTKEFVAEKIGEFFKMRGVEVEKVEIDD